MENPDSSSNPLIPHSSLQPSHLSSPDDLPRSPDEAAHTKTKRLLYTSHFLSTWNSRTFEFGAFLFLANIYPGTLLPASLYAFTRAAAVALLAPFIGQYVDSGERLSVIRASIVGQRFAVTLTCTILYTLISTPWLSTNKLLSPLALALLCLLAALEKLCIVLNTIAVERDWVVVVAGGSEARLRTLNAQMRRIDLFCKLVGPLFVSVLDGTGERVAVLVVAGMTLFSVGIEYIAIARVYHAVPALSAPRSPTPCPPPGMSESPGSSAGILALLRARLSGLAIYTQHPTFLPSLSLSLLYLTVLSFSGQMITYLAAYNYNPSTIGILRGGAALFELSATWLAPRVISRLGAVRAGIWFVNCELGFVFLAAGSVWLIGTGGEEIVGEQGWWMAAMVSAVMASRIGLWGFDLSVQILVQEEVESELRGTFSAHESALQHIFEMLSFASTMVFADPSQFPYPATLSAGAVLAAALLYALFVRKRRGHLLHASRCIRSRQEKRKVILGSDLLTLPEPGTERAQLLGDVESEQ